MWMWSVVVKRTKSETMHNFEEELTSTFSVMAFFPEGPVIDVAGPGSLSWEFVETSINNLCI